MKDAYIRNIEYFLPLKKENNLKLLKILGKDKNLNTIKSKEYALLVGFGVGLSWGLCLIKKC